MKHILFAFAVLLCLVSCSKATYLRADIRSIEVDCEGATGSFTLHSDATNYEIVSTPAWVTAEMNDSVVNYTIARNNSTSDREDYIVVECGGLNLRMRVTQALPATKLSVNQSKVAFPAEGGTKTVKVETDALNVNVKATKGLTATYSEGILTIVAKPEGANGGTVTVYTGKLQATVTTCPTGRCDNCKGLGLVTCIGCNGEGVKYKEVGNHENPMTCDKCESHTNGGELNYSPGSGKMTCPDCGGLGKLE